MKGLWITEEHSKFANEMLDILQEKCAKKDYTNRDMLLVAMAIEKEMKRRLEQRQETYLDAKTLPH